MMNDVTPRPLNVIADEIRKVWAKPYFAAVPYIEAMRYLGSVSDRYINDSGDSIVRYFLGNAKYWRGPDATRIKAELRAALGDDRKRGVR